MVLEGSTRLQILIAVGIVGLFGFLTFALAAATLGTVNKQYDSLNSRFDDLQLRIAAVNDRLSIIINAITSTTTAAPETMTHTTAIVSTEAPTGSDTITGASETKAM